MELSFEQGRIIGALIEKQLTTPQLYPLTLHALLAACNQSSNREPVVNLEERALEVALRDLKDVGAVRYVHPSHGRSVIRYKQVVDELLGIDTKSEAVLAVLLLRGPQTAAEIRARTERMAEFDTTADVESELQWLTTRVPALAVKHARRPGQKEERWEELLTGEAVAPTADTWARESSTNPAESVLVNPTSNFTQPAPAATALTPPWLEHLESKFENLERQFTVLSEEVSAIREQVVGLTESLANLRGELGA